MIKNRDLRFMKIAKAASKCSDFKRTQVGACIVFKGDVLSVGFNTQKTHVLQSKYNAYRDFNGQADVVAKCHGEINAISKLPHYIRENNIDLSNATVYVYREHKNTHEYAQARPCPACYNALVDIGIGRVVYTCDNGIKEEHLTRNLSSRLGSINNNTYRE